MFHSSTQKRYWIFKNEEELNSLRKTANQKYREEFYSTIPENGIGKVNVICYLIAIWMIKIAIFNDK